MLLARRLVNGRERGCLQVVPCIVLRLVNMSTRAMRLKTQARALACLQVVYLTLSVVKEQSLSASLVRLEKELFPLYLGHPLRGQPSAGGYEGVGLAEGEARAAKRPQGHAREPKRSEFNYKPEVDFHLTQNENCHFTICLLGGGRFHARKSGEPPTEGI